ncbi:MAG: BsuPI-related putative proteinase inhibitor, partial [Bacteroidota bacterium]|nr:BsuPI-related putative proteinase inhibitor [Bacteroidota bacterium]
PALAEETVNSNDSADFEEVSVFGISVAIDQPAYWTDFMPPGWHAPVISMALRVFNHSYIPVTFDFTTSQRYDFAIYNSNGIEVWRWSDDKAFLQVLGQVTLEPGESVRYAVKHKFVDSCNDTKEKPMPVDLYTLKGELTARDTQLLVPRTMEGEVNFWHTYVY